MVNCAFTLHSDVSGDCHESIHSAAHALLRLVLVKLIYSQHREARVFSLIELCHHSTTLLLAERVFVIKPAQDSLFICYLHNS